MGKGSGRRPCQVDKKQFEDNYDAIFGLKKMNVVSDAEREELLDEKRKAAAENDNSNTGQPGTETPPIHGT
jgi:hypothetical protein